MKPRVVITQPVHAEVVEMLRAHADVVVDEEWRSHARDADALMVFMPDSIDDDFLAACPRLKIVAAALKGFDNFDVEAWSPPCLVKPR